MGRILTRFLCRILFNLYRKRYIEDGNSPRKQFNSIKMMNRKVLFWPLAAMLLTACEKGLVDEAAVSTTGQVGNSELQVRTRSGGSASPGFFTRNKITPSITDSAIKRFRQNRPRQSRKRGWIIKKIRKKFGVCGFFRIFAASSYR